MPDTMEETAVVAPKFDPKVLAAQLGKEGLKNLLNTPEVAKLRATDPTLSKLDKEDADKRRADEAKADADELKRISELFIEKHGAAYPLNENITKIGAAFKDSSATVYCNYKVAGRANVTKTTVSKQNITEKQYQRRLKQARKHLMVVATLAIELDLDSIEF